MIEETKIERIIEAIEKISFLPNASKKIIIILLKHKAPLPAKAIASLCDFSHPHTCALMKRLLRQGLVTKVKTVYACTYYTVDKEYKDGIFKTYNNSSIYNK